MAQDKTAIILTLQLEPQKIELALRALAQLPYWQVKEIMEEIGHQVDEQIARITPERPKRVETDGNEQSELANPTRPPAGVRLRDREPLIRPKPAVHMPGPSAGPRERFPTPPSDITGPEAA